MKKRALMGVLITTLLVSAAASAHAQSIGRVVTDIPFSFQIGDRALPADQYVVSVATGTGEVLRITGKGGEVRMTLAHGAQGKQLGRPRLVFHKYGDQYFLREVWGSGRDGRLIMESSRERKLRRELKAAAQSAAAKTAGPEVVTVVARYDVR